MFRNCLRLLSLVTILLSSFMLAPRAYGTDPESGDEHWVGELTVSGFDNQVITLASDFQGNIYAGGIFTAYGGELMNHIAKWDGSTWSGLGSGLNEQVNHLAGDSRGNLYTDVLIVPDSGLPETVVMRWDGSSWSALGGDLSSLVDTLAAGRDSNIVINDLVVDSRDQLYVGGYFYLINLDRYVGYVACWDGSNWSLLGSGMNHTVYHLAVDGQNDLYAGGEFTSAGGIPANRVAKWDGVSWNALGSGLGGEAPIIADMAADDSGKLYVTGQLQNAGDVQAPLIAMWNGVSWKNLAPGNNTGWFEGELSTINDLAISPSGDLYAGGSFTTIDGVKTDNIARWDGSTWRALSTTTGYGVNERVSAIAVDGKGWVYVGGLFTSAGGLPAKYIARWDGATWFSWNEGSGVGMNKMVDALAVDHNGDLYAGGYFTLAGNTPANRIARWDGVEWNTLGEGVNAPVHALALDNNAGLYAGGEFTTAGEVPVNYIAKWDGATWNPLGDGVASENTYPQVRALAVDDQGNLFAGGDFTSAGGIGANYIARWDGSAWSALGLGMNDQVTELVVDPRGNLYAAGWFTRAGDIEANGIARWDGSSWSALGSGTSMIEAIAIDSEGNLYAAGMFYIPPDSYTSHYIARWDGHTWIPIDTGLDHFIHTLAVDQEGNLYSGGDFTAIGDEPAMRVARWNGTTWNPLGSGIGAEGDYSTIAILVVDDLGNLYVGGQFTLAGGKPSAYLAKWCAELNEGACSFFFAFRVNTPETTPGRTELIPTPGKTPTISPTVPVSIPSIVPTSSRTDVNKEGGLDGRVWIGVGTILVILFGALFLIRSRRA